jgi:outer membrane receptor protein involved in Fe transport
MTNTSRLRSMLALGVSTAVLLAAAPALAAATDGAAANGAAANGSGANTAADGSGQPAADGNSGNRIQELVVTAQRRSEAIQDVPVAVSAFSSATLKAQRLDGGNNLVLSIPNVNYSRSNFGGYNFQIRGIGEKVVTGGAEAGVSINEDALPLGTNHLGDSDFYDVDRVEVLRGPQGTLYGRNATGGAVNIITAKPNDTPGGSITGEYGNFNTEKVTGFINMPLNDQWSARLAAFYLKRDGFGTNLTTGDDVDNRDLYSIRGTVAWKPNERFHAYLTYEHYNENDNRNRVGKQLCNKDPGPATLAGVPLNPAAQGLLSQGCQATSLYNNNAYGSINSQGTLAGIYAQELGLLSGDAFANNPLQNHNLHDITSAVDPVYEAKQNLIHLNMTWDITDNLTLESVTGYNRNTGFSTEDYTRVVPTTSFNTTATPGCYYCLVFQSATGSAALYPALYNALFPGGVVSDPQAGRSNNLRTFDRTDGDSDERTQEFRLSSHFKGPLNFSAGVFANDTTTNSDYYVFFNPLTGLAQALDTTGLSSIFIDPNNPPANGTGHNYYDSRGTARLQSIAAFGELYYQITDDLKLTLGLRETDDRKYEDEYPIQLAAATPAGGGFGAFGPCTGQTSTVAPTIQRCTLVNNETTGRVNIDWTPHLSFTNQTLVYGSYSRGYKGGGFNTPCAPIQGSTGCGYPLTYQPETIDAFEVGTKNTLLDGRLVLNGDFFFYNYTGYQISTIVAKSSVNTNINAHIYGVELESIYSPVNHLTLNANIGYLHTEITGGSVLDQANLTQGNPNLTLVKASDGSNCVVNTQVLAAILAGVNASPGGAAPGVQQLALLGAPGGAGGATGVCGGQANYAAAGLYNYAGANVSTTVVNGVPVGQGVGASLKGNDLPNSPEFTISIGAQYVFSMPNDWQATVRGDYNWQDSSYARIFNAVEDQLRSWDNVNATLTFANRPLALDIQFYVKNAFNSQPITDAYLTDASSGLFYNTFTLDPRTYGISVTKRF